MHRANHWSRILIVVPAFVVVFAFAAQSRTQPTTAPAQPTTAPSIDGPHAIWLGDTNIRNGASIIGDDQDIQFYGKVGVSVSF